MSESVPVHWRETFRRRAMITAVLVAVWMAGIEARLVFLQVVEHHDLTARATRQQMSRSDAAAKRGDILDRRGQVLATSVSTDSIYAVPSAIEDPKSVVAALCKALGDCTAKDRVARREAREDARVRVRAPPCLAG